jgi:hypothetical protein
MKRISTKLYCPFCGTPGITMDDGPGDYYEGPAFQCASCEERFTLPSFNKYWEPHKKFLNL